MAKPIERLPAFSGGAAKWMIQFLAKPKDEEARAERRREDQNLLQRVKPMKRDSSEATIRVAHTSAVTSGLDKDRHLTDQMA